MLNFLLTHTPLLYFVQSIWRDEAYSILMAEKPISYILNAMIFETPLHYLMLHIWIKLAGNGEFAARIFSLLGFVLATIVIIEWGAKIYKNKWLSVFLPITFFLNPMLIYYAFEIRSYPWVIFFVTVTMVSYLEKKWYWYAIGAILAFYTHAYTILIPFTTGIHYLLFHTPKSHFRRFKTLLADPFIRSTAFILLAITPWLIRIVTHVALLQKSWYYPIDMQLIKSVLGNMFLGYEGTPGYLWPYTTVLSLAFLAMAANTMRNKSIRERVSYMVMVMLVPLILMIGISLVKPLFVNRYFLFVTIAQVMLCAFFVESIKKPMTQKIVAFFFVTFLIGFNIWYPALRPKKDIRSTVKLANTLAGDSGLIYADSSLIFFETLYYSTDRSRVFYYNPQEKPFYWYIGDALITSEQIATELPTYPKRAFIIRRDGTFYLTYNTLLTTGNK